MFKRSNNLEIASLFCNFIKIFYKMNEINPSQRIFKTKNKIQAKNYLT